GRRRGRGRTHGWRRLHRDRLDHGGRLYNDRRRRRDVDAHGGPIVVRRVVIRRVVIRPIEVRPADVHADPEVSAGVGVRRRQGKQRKGGNEQKTFRVHGQKVSPGAECGSSVSVIGVSGGELYYQRAAGFSARTLAPLG